VLQCGDGAGLALEARGELRIAVGEQDLDGDKAVEGFLVGFVDRSHAAVADRLDQLILPKPHVLVIAHRASLGAGVALGIFYSTPNWWWQRRGDFRVSKAHSLRSLG